MAEAQPKTAYDAQADFRAALERLHLLFRADSDEIDSDSQFVLPTQAL